jgi:predicted ArsR family transcriptional regulator
MTVTTLGQIEAVSSPVRSRILRLARKPITVAELANRMGVPTTRLYYHVNLLVEQGMLAQVDERKSGARIEKIYLRTAGTFKLGNELAEEIGDPRKTAEAAATVIFDTARADVEDVMVEIFSGHQPVAEFGRTVTYLTPEDAKEFANRLSELTRDLLQAGDPEQPGRATYSFTAIFVPIELEEEHS